MGTFKIDVEIGDPRGERYERVGLTVDTGSTYTVVPRSVLDRLQVEPYRTAQFRLADGRVTEGELGQTWVRIDGRSAIRLVVFDGEGDEPLLGADTMEGLLLAPDPVAKRLVPVEGLLMPAIGCSGDLQVATNVR